MRADTDTLRDTLIKWTSINTHSYNLAGLAQLQAMLTADFAKLGTVNTHTLAPFERIDDFGCIHQQAVGALLSLQKKRPGKKSVLLVGHYDTVFPLTSDFDAGCIVEKDHKLHGPGVADMKGGLVVLLHALLAFEQTPQAADLAWQVMITPDEEIGSPASMPMLLQAAQQHDYALVFEPSLDEQGTLAADRKGSANYTIVVRGQSAHAGRDFAKGRNAIMAMQTITQQLHDLNAQREGVTVNIGTLHGGQAVNQVADVCVARVNMRMPTLADFDWLAEHVKQIVCVPDDYTVTVQGGLSRPPRVLSDEALAFYQLARDVADGLGEDLRWQNTGGVCDGNNLAALMPVIDNLGVCGGGIHTCGEYVCLDSLVGRLDLLVGLLGRLAAL